MGISHRKGFTMTITKEQELGIRTAWAASEKAKLAELVSIAKDLDLDLAFVDALRAAQITPYYHFRGDFLERLALDGDAGRPTPKKDAPFGHESAEPVQETAKAGLPSCTKCRTQFTPKFAGATVCFDCWKKEHPKKKYEWR